MNFNERGFSLTELLISMALGAFLLAGLFTVYLSNKKTYQLEESLARLQENGRLAIYLLNQDIRMAGYAGCARSTDSESLMIWSANQPGPIAVKAAPGTDILLIQKLDPDTVSAEKATSHKVIAKSTVNFTKKDQLLISDCNQAQAITIRNINGKIIEINGELAETYSNESTEIGRLQKIIYYVSKTKRKTANGKPIFALYRRDLNAAKNLPQELIEGLTDMKITRNGNVVKISLMLDSLSEHHLRSEWRTVIALRESI